METFSVPDEDPDGESLADTFMDLKDGMGEGYLLAQPLAASDLDSPMLEPERACTYGAAISTLREFVQEYQRGLPATDEYKKDDFSKTTMHSLRAWLATLTRQAGAPAAEIDELLHWKSLAMQRLYDRSPPPLEVRTRSRIVALLASPWRSAGGKHKLNAEDPALRWTTILQRRGHARTDTFRF